MKSKLQSPSNKNNQGKYINKIDSCKNNIRSAYTKGYIALLVTCTLGMGFLGKQCNSTDKPIRSSEKTKEKEKTKKTYEELTQQEKIYYFGDYIAKNYDIARYDSINSKGVSYKTDFGKYARILRYEKEITNAKTLCPSISDDRFKALCIVEGQGNPGSCNFNDGGAGIVHIQPDVAKREYKMKVFTDNPKYAHLDFDKLSKSGKTTAAIYKLHGEALKKIVQEDTKGDLNALIRLDDRFNVNLCYAAVAKRLEKAYKIGVEKEQKDRNKFKELKDFAETIDMSRQEAYALNAYNKGQGSGTASFTYGNKTYKRGHLKNVVRAKNIYTKFTIILKENIQKGYKDDELREKISTETDNGLVN